MLQGSSHGHTSECAKGQVPLPGLSPRRDCVEAGLLGSRDSRLHGKRIGKRLKDAEGSRLQ